MPTLKYTVCCCPEVKCTVGYLATSHWCHWGLGGKRGFQGSYMDATKVSLNNMWMIMHRSGCVWTGLGCDGDISHWTSQTFLLLDSSSLGGMTLCPCNWLTEGYFPNDSGCSCPEMNDLLYLKWQTGCFHSTLAPGTAAVTLFGGSGALVIKRGGGNRPWVPVSLGLREAWRNARFLRIQAALLWSEVEPLRFQWSFSFWFSSKQRNLWWGTGPVGMVHPHI